MWNWIPKNLTNKQKDTRVHIRTEWLENWDIFNRAVTGYKSWIFAYDPEMQKQSWDWKTLELWNEESADIQIANESHDRHILRLLRYNFETLGTALANYHCYILHWGAQDIVVSDREKTS